MTPAAHFAKFCETVVQSDDPWEGQLFKLEPWQRRFWREALGDWRSVVLIVPRKNGEGDEARKPRSRITEAYLRRQAQDPGVLKRADLSRSEV